MTGHVFFQTASSQKECHMGDKGGKKDKEKSKKQKDAKQSTKGKKPAK
jgi:hypothetical protein